MCAGGRAQESEYAIGATNGDDVACVEGFAVLPVKRRHDIGGRAVEAGAEDDVRRCGQDDRLGTRNG